MNTEIEQLKTENAKLKAELNDAIEALDAANNAGSAIVGIIINGGEKLDKLRSEFVEAKRQMMNMAGGVGNN